MDFALRVTITHDQTGTNLIDLCNKYFDEYLMVYENPDDDCHNEHYHVHGWTNAKEETLRKALQRLFPKAYSIKEADERNLQYICKGTVDEPPVIVSSKGMQYDCPRVYWERYWAEFVEQNGEYDPDFNTAGAKAKRSRDFANTVRQEVFDACIENGTTWRNREAIMFMLVDRYVQDRRNLNKFHLQSIVRFIQYELAPPAEKCELARQMCEGM